MLDLRDKYIYLDNEIICGPYAYAVEGLRTAPVIDTLTGESLSFVLTDGVVRFVNEGSEIDLGIPNARTFFGDY
jgi:hypothetical protein